jgi:chromosome partitioning protein
LILSIVNVKGGVGKTTTAVNLAAVFAESGLSTLVVDLDPQGSASYSLGLPKDYKGRTLADVLLLGHDPVEAIMDTGLEGVDLIPGDLRLATSEVALARRPDPEKRLSKALSGLRRKYDCILIDSPPGLSLLTTMALQASNAYLVPTSPHDLAVDALGRFFEGLEMLKGTVRRATQCLGIVVTMVDHRTNTTAEVVSQIRRQYKAQVFKTEVPINIKLAEAPRYGRTILEYESWSPGGVAYRSLGGEVIRRMRQRGLL